jgi:hypothetical protein
VAKCGGASLLASIVAAEAGVTTIVRRVVMKAVKPLGTPGY